MGLNLDVRVKIEGSYTGANDIAAPEQAINLAELMSFLTGSGSGLASKVFMDTRTLAASASESLDLSGPLTDAFGAALLFTKVKAVLVKAHGDNVNSVILGAAATNPFLGPWGATGTHTVLPGGLMLAADPVGFVVTPATGDLLKVANSGGTTGVTYDIVIIGE